MYFTERMEVFHALDGNVQKNSGIIPGSLVMEKDILELCKLFSSYSIVKVSVFLFFVGIFLAGRLN